jgi:hypothetical protein
MEVQYLLTALEVSKLSMGPEFLITKHFFKVMTFTYLTQKIPWNLIE